MMKDVKEIIVQIREYLEADGNEYYGYEREDVAMLGKYCTMLAEKINGLIDENERLKSRIERLEVSDATND